MRVSAFLAAASLSASACLPLARPAPTPSATPLTVKIVSSFPLQGPGRSVAIQLVNAIRMALDEQGGKAGTTTVLYESFDGASAAQQGWDGGVEAENARRAARDPSVVAYIGTFNSGAAQVSIPITCAANLVMISPANTYSGLTRAAEPGEPGKYYPGCARNYARVVAPDDAQGAAGARWARKLGLRRAFVVHDGGLYGRVLSEAFRAEARRVGIEEVGYDAAPRAQEFRALADRVAASGADLLYYGGTIEANPGFLLRDLRRARPEVSFMAPDGVIDPRFTEQAGAAALGAYVTAGLVSPSNYAGKAKLWAETYAAKHDAAPFAYTMYAYEATKAVLAAIAGAGDRAGDRAVVRDRLMGTRDFAGVIGTWSFDANGDISLISLAGLRVTDRGGAIAARFETLLD
ncbi:MAG TPA: branched-chain amino acid ABC transporter substrate-binding protein [Candidatus Limnocylindria bacterium]|nr:branched-chain amino acid ABC transporter substrate-binding protein [Candidatus Limnocylindria bacterium]